jgi:hypothetical protein
MNRTPALLPLLALAIAACSTDNQPLIGFAKQPDNTLFLQGTAGFQIEAVMQVDAPQTFRLRFNGQYGVWAVATADDGTPGPWVYAEVDVQEWVASTVARPMVPPGTYVVELVDASGTSWGETPPITVQHPAFGPAQPATIIFVHLDGLAATWVLDPTTADSDPATMDTTVTNLSHEDVTVQRCPPGVAAVGPTCTSLGTVAAGADLHTLETVTLDTTATQMTRTSPDATLFVGSYERALETAPFSDCQIERIVVTGTRTLREGTTTNFAMSACNTF